MTYLKRLRASDRQIMLCGLVCIMRIITQIVALTSHVMIVSQETKMNIIVKNFATIALIQNIDTMFTETVPKDIVDLANEINKNGGFTIQSDQNSWSRSLHRLWYHDMTLESLLFEIRVIMLNLFLGLFINFYIIFYNYFGPLLIIYV